MNIYAGIKITIALGLLLLNSCEPNPDKAPVGTADLEPSQCVTVGRFNEYGTTYGSPQPGTFARCVDAEKEVTCYIAYRASTESGVAIDCSDEEQP